MVNVHLSKLPNVGEVANAPEQMVYIEDERWW